MKEHHAKCISDLKELCKKYNLEISGIGAVRLYFRGSNPGAIFEFGDIYQADYINKHQREFYKLEKISIPQPEKITEIEIRDV